MEPLSKKQVREAENDQCVGGMRNPNSAVARNPQLQRIGSSVRRVLDEAVRDFPEILKLTRALKGDVNAEEIDELAGSCKKAWKATAERLAASLGCKDWEHEGPTGWRTNLLRAIVKAANDPDVDVADWLDGNTPLGIKQEVPYRGVFPESRQLRARRIHLASHQS